MTRSAARLQEYGERRWAMAFLISQLLFLLFGLLGLLVWSSADMPMAVREIAINTRKDSSQGSAYPMIKVLSACMRIFAVLLWLAGIAAVAAVIVGFPIAL
jgi:ABC-type spermidine/putrescine transport system permease subunit I